jgi:hypothetical protein
MIIILSFLGIDRTTEDLCSNVEQSRIICMTGGQLIEFHLTFSVDRKFLIIWAFDQILFWRFGVLIKNINILMTLIKVLIN